jgi:hypothetical protein
VHSTLGIPPIADTAMITSQANFEIITTVQQDVFRDEIIRLWGEWAE